MRNLDAINVLKEIAKSWGGVIEVVSTGEFEPFGALSDDLHNGWTRPPENGHALHYETRRMVVDRKLACAGTIIHEMGHAFVDESNPEEADEWDWFGWEICLARKVGCYRRWSKSSRHYIVTVNPGEDLISWKRLTSSQKAAVTDERIKHAIKIGIVDPNGDPRAVR